MIIVYSKAVWPHCAKQFRSLFATPRKRLGNSIPASWASNKRLTCCISDSFLKFLLGLHASGDDATSWLVAKFLEDIVPTLLLKHQRRHLRLRGVLAAVALLRELLDSGIDVVLVDHDTRLGATSFDTKLGAETVEVERARLELGI